MSSETGETRENLSETPSRQDAFVDLLVDYLLSRRMGNFIDLGKHVKTGDTSDVVARFSRQFLRREETRRMIAEGINSAINSADTLDGTLREVFPDELTDHLKDLVDRNYQANEILIRSMIEHPTMRIVIRNVLQETLREFVDRTAEWIEESGRIPGMKGAWNLFLRAFGMARSVTKRFAEEYERRIEERIETFVDDVIDESIDKMILQLTSEEMVPRLTEWRRDLVDVLLDQPIGRYLEEFRKFEPEESLDDVGEIFLVIAEWEHSPDLIEALMESGLRQLEDRTVEELLTVMGLYERVRGRLSDFLETQVDRFLESDSFKSWSNDSAF